MSGPRDLLSRCGIDESQFAKLLDGRPVDEEETEVLLRILFRIRDVPMLSIERWSEPSPSLAMLVEQSQPSRGRMFRLKGRVTSAEVCRPAPEVSERFELPRYYRCRLLLEDGQPAEVFAGVVPKAWQAGGRIDQRASASGLLLKLAGKESGRPLPVFVAQRLAWHPATLLGDLGMDVGLLDDVENRKPLTAADREGFYQMLFAAKQAPPGTLLREANRQLQQSGETSSSVVPLFNAPQSQRGRLVALSGMARRVLLIRVGDPDIQERFKIDHYYEIELVTGDSQGNPLTFCTTDLPQGMPTGEGQQFGERVRVAGFFFKTWSYRIFPLDDGTKPVRPATQLAPLLIGQEPIWYPQEKPGSYTLAGAIAAGALAAALALGSLLWWRYSRKERQLHEQILAKSLGLDAGVALDASGPDAEGDSGRDQIV